MKHTKFIEKLNKIDGNIYVVEELVSLTDGVYEQELAHDHVNPITLSVHTGSKLTGDKIDTYVLSTPSLEPWKQIIRVYAEVPEVYISYETDGDTVEAEDVNDVQAAIGDTQTALDEETARAEGAETSLEACIAAETERAESAELSLTDSVRVEAARAKGAETAIQAVIDGNKPTWDDKYTKNEVDNKFATLETAIDWKESVAVFADIAKTYPAPEDGWTVNVKDTDYTYRYSGSAWVAISANAIPKATQSVDGLLSKEDKTNYDDANVKKHIHSNRSVIDKVTEVLLANWNDAYTKRHEHENRAVLDKITQALLDNWSAAFTHIGSKGNPHGVTKAQVGLGAVEDKTGAVIRGEMTKEEVVKALGYTPPTSSVAYTHPNSGAAAGTYRSVTVNVQGHVTTGTNPTTLAGYGITDAAAASHNHDAAYLKKGIVTWNNLKGV